MLAAGSEGGGEVKTLIVIEVEHKKPLPHLAEMIAQRAYAMDGVDNAVVQEDVAERVSRVLMVRQQVRVARGHIDAHMQALEAALK